MAYTPKTWRDYPSTETLVMASDLNRIEKGIDDAHKGLDNKLDKPETTGTADQVLTLGADGKPVWSDPSEDITVDDALSEISENPVQNKVIKSEIDKKIEKPTTQGTEGKVLKLDENLEPTWGEGGGNANNMIFDSKNEYESARDSGQIPEDTVCYYPEEGDSGEIYSEEETVIGTWIDGKPIYRKVIRGTYSTSGTNMTVPNGNANVEQYVRLEGFVNTTENINVPINTYSGTSTYVLAWGRTANASVPDSILFKCLHTNFDHRPFIIIIEYTKTTD